MIKYENGRLNKGGFPENLRCWCALWTSHWEVWYHLCHLEHSLGNIDLVLGWSCSHWIRPNHNLFLFIKSLTLYVPLIIGGLYLSFQYHSITHFSNKKLQAILHLTAFYSISTSPINCQVMMHFFSHRISQIFLTFYFSGLTSSSGGFDQHMLRL